MIEGSPALETKTLHREGLRAMRYRNLSQMHRHVAERLGPKTALRFKQDGLYHDIAWTEYRSTVDELASGLIEVAGIRPGDRIAILSENRWEWLATDLGILAASAVVVPLHAPIAAKQAAYQLHHSGVRGVFVSNRSQWDKIASVREELPDLEFIVSFDDVGNDACLKECKAWTWNGLRQRGAIALEKTRTERRSREETCDEQSLATIIYTSGTTGNPKGVMLDHGNLVSNAEAMLSVAALTSSDILLSWLPYSHIYARTVDHYQTILAESVVALAESADTLIVNLAEVQPTWITAVPRFYEKVWQKVEQLPPEPRGQTLRSLFGPRIRWLSSGGAPLPPHIARGFAECGFDLLEGYGLTETSPVISFNRSEQHRIGSVGLCVPGVEVRIAEDGEVLTRGRHVMRGYWREPEATAAAIRDGWFHTGDLGKLDDDGYLWITGRKKDLLITSSGKNISPAEIERILVTDPYIDQAILYGDGRHFVSALLIANVPLLERKAEELGCGIQIEEDFVTTPPLLDFLATRVEHLMKDVSRAERVKRFLVLGRPLRLEEDEITATQKVRRKAVLTKFEDRLDQLYFGPPLADA